VPHEEWISDFCMKLVELSFMEEKDWKKKLNPEQYRVMREGGSEAAFAGKYHDNEGVGTYKCSACGAALFKSKDKCDPETGYANFVQPIDQTRLEYKQNTNPDGSIEYRCKKCHSSLGLLMPNRKYRAYSVALDFEPNNRLEMLETTKDRLEDAEDIKERVSGDSDNSLEGASGAASSLAHLVGGGVMGLIVGATGAYLLCQAACIAISQNPILVPLAATTTAPVVHPIEPATTTPQKATTTVTHIKTPPKEPAGGTVTPQPASSPPTPAPQPSSPIPVPVQSSAESATSSVH
jgi:peptide-methionine (R)-S-oxide reductase